MHVRRVVTGHDASGRATVVIDEVVDYARSRRPNHQAFVAWSTDRRPISNEGNEDGRLVPVTNGTPDSTIFRIVEYAPGVAPRRHRTNSLDYAVVMSGEIDMELDDETVTLRAGDVLVQRGTIHNWVNRGTAPCVIAFVLLAAAPMLPPEG